MDKLSKLEWCCIQKSGIGVIEPSDRIAKEYIQASDQDIIDMKKASSKWKNIMAYYACYNAFYAILQKAGIKCEIHSCTIELTKFFRLSKEQIEFFKNLKSTRINVQYYLQTPKSVEESKVIDFVTSCKQVLYRISYDEIEKIRKKIEQIILEAKS